MIEKRTCIHDFVRSGNLDELCNAIAQTTSRWQNYRSQSSSGGPASFVMPGLLPFPRSVEKSDEQQRWSLESSSSSGHGDGSVLDGDGENAAAKRPRKRKRRRHVKPTD
jgi:non-canonical poly(A) RNA polymerase PAPD5/7